MLDDNKTKTKAAAAVATAAATTTKIYLRPIEHLILKHEPLDSETEAKSKKPSAILEKHEGDNKKGQKWKGEKSEFKMW
jgi:hypothetical protein